VKGFICGNIVENRVATVIPQNRIDRIKQYMELSEEIIGFHNIEQHKDRLHDAEIMWSTWGIERFNKEQLEQYFPRLKAVFYCAGSVQCFARPFLERGIRVFSAWGANAVPVGEYTLGAILLATKGGLKAIQSTRLNFGRTRRYCSLHSGAYRSSVGLIGLGMIGGVVAEKLQHFDMEVLAYDPFASTEKAERLGVTLVDNLADLFSRCDIISNHLADNDKTKNMLNYPLFSKMKPYATFINTARGAQVVEKDLTRALWEVKTRTAFLDVTVREPVSVLNPLYWRPNAIFTPHIAGSMGGERFRMADYMIEEFLRFSKNEPCLYEITPPMLTTMA
jgi:phosphoglycerate dehydrogenase-like enzyme